MGKKYHQQALVQIILEYKHISDTKAHTFTCSLTVNYIQKTTTTQYYIMKWTILVFSIDANLLD